MACLGRSLPSISFRGDRMTSGASSFLGLAFRPPLVACSCCGFSLLHTLGGDLESLGRTSVPRGPMRGSCACHPESVVPAGTARTASFPAFPLAFSRCHPTPNPGQQCSPGSTADGISCAESWGGPERSPSPRRRQLIERPAIGQGVRFGGSPSAGIGVSAMSPFGPISNPGGFWRGQPGSSPDVRGRSSWG